jgi:hypothetical protein
MKILPNHLFQIQYRDNKTVVPYTREEVVKFIKERIRNEPWIGTCFSHTSSFTLPEYGEVSKKFYFTLLTKEWEKEFKDVTPGNDQLYWAVMQEFITLWQRFMNWELTFAEMDKAMHTINYGERSYELTMRDGEVIKLEGKLATYFNTYWDPTRRRLELQIGHYPDDWYEKFLQNLQDDFKIRTRVDMEDIVMIRAIHERV